jgi:hypothetical protein
MGYAFKRYISWKADNGQGRPARQIRSDTEIMTSIKDLENAEAPETNGFRVPGSLSTHPVTMPQAPSIVCAHVNFMIERSPIVS